MKFICKIIDDLLSQNKDLSVYNIILPGKRPIVFIKKTLADKAYTGMLPDFFTIEELIGSLSCRTEIKGISLWLFAYSVFQEVFSDEDFSSFLKWFPTLQKDWDDILKYAYNDKEVLEYMLDDERIKNWGETLNTDASALKRNLDFWKKMNVFLPLLRERLEKKNWATAGRQHREVQQNIEQFATQTDKKWVFCGFNAFTPTEEKLVKTLLRYDKALCYFQADEYYISDIRQEAGKFLREHKKWKEFNDYRGFNWIEKSFEQPKNITVYEVSGNVSQTKILSNIFDKIQEVSDTALILLDENLLPATLDTLSARNKINITMGFPLKNLSFSNAIKKLFYIQKQQEKREGSFYYNDVLNVLDSIPNSSEDEKVIKNFIKEIQERNMVYIAKNKLNELLNGLSYLYIFHRPDSAKIFLEQLLNFCNDLKQQPLDDIQYENISHFEKSFRIIKNQIADYHFEIQIETLESLINQLINLETIDFIGEPLEGLQIMGLLETRLLNFKNIILLSTNEGKLPLGNTQNTYLPFDVRERFGLHTFLENDSIYAYHFYRLLQGADNIHLLYNALSSGVNTGEKSRFITQIQMESKHKIEEMVIENISEPVDNTPITIAKTEVVISKLNLWKEKISASSLTTYLYDPIQFYFNNILNIREEIEVEEELSQRNYGNLVHYALEFIYSKWKGKALNVSDIEEGLQQIDSAINSAIKKLKHQQEFYATGMNYIHKAIAKRTIENILQYDLNLIASGRTIEIIDVERRIEQVPFLINDSEQIKFIGFIDRIDRLDGKLRVIDYKTSRVENLNLNINGKEETLLMNKDYKQALQLCIYMYYTRHLGETAEAGIWSFAEVDRGVQTMKFESGDLDTAMVSIRNLITEILNPEQDFVQS